MRYVRGGWVAFFVGRVDFRLHWSLPLVAFLVGAGLPYRVAAFALLRLVHELGHAVCVRAYRMRVSRPSS